MKKLVVLACATTFLCVLLTGCGETVSGIGKDVNRMGRGVNTFFFRQPQS